MTVVEVKQLAFYALVIIPCIKLCAFALVPQEGLEPPTRGFSVLCYYQLSYRGKWSK